MRLTGVSGYDVRLVDLSEGGALLEVDAPLRPGVILTLELSGPGLDTAVPMEVLRCYIANLRGETATYRGACAFAHLIELPGKDARPLPAGAAANFVGTDAALKYLLDRCTSPGATGITLERNEVLHVLDALHARTAARDERFAEPPLGGSPGRNSSRAPQRSAARSRNGRARRTAARLT